MNFKLLSLAVVLTCVALFAIDDSPARAQNPTATSNARVIVKYKAESPLLRREALAAGTERLSAQEALATGKERQSAREALSQHMGLALRAGADVGERTQVLFARGMTSQELASRLARESDVEYAEPDQRVRLHAAPNDPLYLSGPPISGNTGGPASGQWYLRAPTTEARAAINAEAAWNYTFGSPNIVVAVLDTGVRFDHADLLRVAAGGNLLSGYDMVSDVDIANDGDGRDPDASDPGDWVTAAEANQGGGPFEGCDETDSDWHGTQTAGLVAALTGNGIGMASVGRNVRVLPIRVSGKCEGFVSDVVAGMRWAVGIPVAGVPVNPNPARVLSLSLGSAEPCSAAYLSAIADVTAAGALVVASAGNDSHSVASPANCPGVIAVAGLRHAGTKSPFSNLGPEIALGAPAGNCVDVGANDPCRYPILTTTNPGLTVPTAHMDGGSIYTDAFNYFLGTSFSAPLVAGTAALMLSAQPGLSGSSVRTLLQQSARPFSTSGAEDGGAPLPQCTAPQFDTEMNPIDQLQCYCTTAVCGAGMLDAGAAVSAALGLQAHIDVTPGNPLAGQLVTLSGASSVASGGHSIIAYQWEITDSGGIVTGFLGSANAVTASIQTATAGRFSVRLTVTDNLGLTATTISVIDVASFIANLNFQGMWWNAPAGSESGWGINFAHQGDVIFATWFTHDANGNAWYMSMTAFQTGPNTFAGTLYRTTGPPLDANPFDTSQVQRIAVGSGTLMFSDGNNGTFIYTVNGISQTKSITRQVFGALPTCTWGGFANLALASNYQDLWWAVGGLESGWGINFAHQGDVIFATWFTYDFAGAALPLSATLNRVGQGVYSGSLIKTAGPAFSAVPFNPNAVTRAIVGTATVTFSNGNAATFSYQVALGSQSVSRSKAIERQVFRAPGTVCQ